MNIGIHGIKQRIAHCISWLIVLKGVINLLWGIVAFFGNTSAFAMHYVNNILLFWDFSLVKSFTAVLIGAGFIILGRGLYQGKRLAWQVTLCWLFINLLISLFPHIILFQVIYTCTMLLILWLTREAFYKNTQNPLRPQQVAAFFSIIFVLAYGVIGCYLLRAQYKGINDWIDAVYYSLETYSTIGYGDITPLTENAKIFTCSMIVLGVGTFIAAISILLGPALEARMKKVVNMVNKFNNPKNHIIVIGANAFGLYIAKQLQDDGKAVIIVDRNPEPLKQVENATFNIINGDATHSPVLTAAGINTASGLVSTLTSDAENLLVAMVAQELRKQANLACKIIIRIDEPQNIRHALANGADEVISPAVAFGEKVADILSTESVKTQ